MMRFIRPVPTIILFLFGLLVAYNNKISPHFFVVNLLVLIAFIYLDIYIHEFGHVIAAKLVGIGVNGVIIGNGKELSRKTLFGIPLVITNNFVGGFTIMGSIERKLLKLRFAFFIAGGVLLQSLLIASCAVLLGTKDWTYLYANGTSVTTMFVISNLLLIATNLFPRHINVCGIRMPNDGLRLLKAPFLKEQDIHELLFADRIFKANELFAKKEYRAAATAYEKCIEECPSLPILRLNLSVALLKLFNLEKAETMLLQLSREAGIDKVSCLIYNNLAWINLLYYTDEAIEKADDFSKKAFELNSKVNAIIGTRGSVLIALGRFNEGIELLSRITNIRKEIDTRTNNATNFIFLAYGYFMTNKGDEGCKYLNRAESYYVQMDADEKHFFELIINRMKADANGIQQD